MNGLLLPWCNAFSFDYICIHSFQMPISLVYYVRTVYSCFFFNSRWDRLAGVIKIILSVCVHAHILDRACMYLPVIFGRRDEKMPVLGTICLTLLYRQDTFSLEDDFDLNLFGAQSYSELAADHTRQKFILCDVHVNRRLYVIESIFKEFASFIFFQRLCHIFSIFLLILSRNVQEKQFKELLFCSK